MKKHRDIKVIGAGIAGISACYHANVNDYNCEIFESSTEPGGLLSGFKVDDFVFDNAIHLSFTSSDYVKSLFSTTAQYKLKPESYCYYKNLWIKHPVQNNLYDLGIAEKLRILAGYFSRPNTSPTNYEEWLKFQYGGAFTEIFPKPYTKKYWTVDAATLGIDWISNRMRRSNAREIFLGAVRKETPNHYYANEMSYPTTGGYFSFVKPMLASTKIRYSKRLIKVILSKKELHFSDDSVVHYESLINTMPLPEFVKICDEVPTHVKDAADSLWATKIDLVSVGFKKPVTSSHLWFYIYDKDNLAARAYSPNLKSNKNVPEGKSSLQFEIYSSKHTANRMSPDLMKEKIVESIIRMNLATLDEILFVHHKCLPFANVVFDIGMESRRDAVRDFVASAGVQLAGRFGEWEYFWSDQSLLSGKRAFERIMLEDNEQNK